MGYFDSEACGLTEVQGAITPASLSIAFWNKINRLGSPPKAARIADVSAGPAKAMVVLFFIKHSLPFLQALCAYRLHPQK